MTFTEIISDARRLSKSDSTRYDIDDLTLSANRAVDRIVALIRKHQGRWQWDDSNDDDFAISTTDLVTTLGSEQQDYQLDPTHYRIERVEVKDADGNWHKLASLDQSDIYNQSLTDFLSGAGLPQYYDKVGNSIFLYPKPLATAVTESNGLKVFYERGPSYFISSDTTKEPGFNPLFHRLVSMWTAYDYALINLLPVAKNLREEIAVAEDELANYYLLRDMDDHIRIRPRIRNYR